MKKLFTPILLLVFAGASGTKTGNADIEKIMRDPKWMGVSPSNIRWSDDSRNIYFNWNPKSEERDGLFSITPTNLKPREVTTDEQRDMPPENGSWNKKAYAENL
jgi:hypothetical protein